MIGHIQLKIFHVGFRRHLILCKGKMVRMPDWCCQGSHNFSLGTVYLQGKLSTLSIVSVELENEGRLLLEDRHPGLRSNRSTISTLPQYMLQEYHQAIIPAVWMIILSLIPQAVGAILLGFLICAHVMRPRIEYHQAIISAVGMIILSLIPQDPVRAGAILLGFLIYLHAMRPRMKALQFRLSLLEEKLRAVEREVIRQLDTSFTNQFKRDIEK